MKPNQAADLTYAVENAAEIIDLSASNVTQCAKNCDVVLICDGDGGGNPPVVQCEKLCTVVSDAAFNCDVIRPK